MLRCLLGGAAGGGLRVRRESENSEARVGKPTGSRKTLRRESEKPAAVSQKTAGVSQKTPAVSRKTFWGKFLAKQNIRENCRATARESARPPAPVSQKTLRENS